MPEREKNSGKKIGIPEERQGRVRTWNEMSELLRNMNIDVESVPQKEKRYAKKYFNAQKLIAEGDLEKAEKIFASVETRSDYRNFEDKNIFLLKAIDIAVKGKSQQRNNF